MIDDIQNCTWHTGSGNVVNFEDILINLKSCIKNGGKIFVGSDSFVTNRKINFTSAICLYGDEKGGRYFFFKEKVPRKNYGNALVTRITEEVKRSVDIAEILTNVCGISASNIELHLDISPKNLKNGTSKFCEMLYGYVVGSGFSCKIKPEAWASQSVADRHSK